MAERLEDGSSELESTTVGIFRTAAVVKGGRRFSFAALVVVGDRRGRVGVGYGKAPGVPAAIEKAQKYARKAMITVNLQEGTIPHTINSRFGASMVRMVPAAPGTGVIAGATVRAVLEMAGVKDCLSKAYGSTNQRNLVKAAIDGLKALRRKDQIAYVRGVELEETDVEKKLELGRKYAPAVAAKSERVKGPVNKVGDKTGKTKGKRRRDDESTEAAAPVVGEATKIAAPENPAPPATPA